MHFNFDKQFIDTDDNALTYGYIRVKKNVNLFLIEFKDRLNGSFRQQPFDFLGVEKGGGYVFFWKKKFVSSFGKKIICF